FVMIATSGFGMLLAIAYSIVILIVARNYITKVRKNYLDLLEVTKNIAEGNLEKEVNQDLGIFNSFKEDITNIRYSFKNAVDEEVKSQKMKTELISNVSHDLKTPLTSIITYTDLLKRTDITEEERTNYFETLERNEVRLKHLIEDLFEVSKVNSGNVQLNIQQIDIISLMSQVIIEHEDSIKKLELSIKTNYSDEKILLNLDSQKTYRVLANLITNISKYAMPKSRVYVEVTDYGESVELSFKNMSANEIDFDPNDIVERFARGDKARNTEGSGLGLA
ncbi:MAG: HAMP domain-containing sensor histidine kinase, partial [Longicatena sp.]